MTRHSHEARISRIEDTLHDHLDEARSMQSDVKELMTMMRSVKRWAVWILWGLLIPILEAAGIDLSSLINGGGG